MKSIASEASEASPPKRVLVCGGRLFTDYQFLAETLSRELAPWLPDVEIIQGAARGADMLAAKWAWYNCTPRSRFFAISDEEWARFGKGAGPARNARMLALGKPELVIAFPGDSGTRNMMEQARAAGVEVREIIIPYTELVEGEGEGEGEREEEEERDAAA